MYFYCIKNMCMASVEELINNYLWHSMIIHMLCYPKLNQQNILALNYLKINFIMKLLGVLYHGKVELLGY